MLFLNDMCSSVRNNSVEWNCHEVTISQDGFAGGYLAKGYGVIQSDENGCLYLEFICLNANFKIEPRGFLPEDPLDAAQSVTMRAKRLDGIEFTSYELLVKGSMYHYVGSDPKIFNIQLGTIEVAQRRKKAHNNDSTLCLEFKAKPTIPTNVVNKTESTLGTESVSWNETKLNLPDYEVRVITHDSHTEVRIVGPESKIEIARKAVVFYINFSTGFYVQPYFESLSKPDLVTTTKFYSVDGKKINLEIPMPLSASARDEENQSFDQNHFALLDEIYNVLIEAPEVFASVSSQWHRIWHSFSSYEVSVPMLTIAVAVEGVLNDVFMPAIDKNIRDQSFELEKKRVMDLINGVDGLSKDHIATINGSIIRWGRNNPKKSLNFLAAKEAIEKRHVNNWVALRNSVAHPALTTKDASRRRKDLDRMFVCIGLFYQLVLNVFSYSGAQFAFENSSENKLVVREHIEIL